SLFISWAIILSYFFVEFKYRIKDLGAFVVPLAFFMMLYASSLPQESAAFGPSKKFWLTIHLTLSMLGISAFAIAFGASIMYLLQEKLLKTKKIGSLYQRLPSLEILDNVMHWIIAIGFPIFTIGFITGSIWIERTNGSYFSWNVQKTLPLLITWSIYGSLFLGRIIAGWRRKKVAVLSIIGFFSVIITYLLHVY
ncbi:MAG TPA: cytochrome c biogenesis protein CcsA, partial [Nitrospinota bacterium]|nr:cytochrome c biogenesis protein CcsA [Nitrospinota bacterium]